MRQDVWPVVRCPGSRFFPAYLYSGEHSSKPEWLIARGRQRVRVTSRGEATRLLFSSLKGLQVKWGFRLEVKSRLASRLALYPRRQHDHNVDATRRPAGQGSSGPLAAVAPRSSGQAGQREARRAERAGLRDGGFFGKEGVRGCLYEFCSRTRGT